MGVPAFEIKEQIEKFGISVFSSNYTLYGDMSNRIMSTLSRFTPEIEIYSIDEAFLQFNGFEHYDLSEYAQQIKKITTRNTGIPISIGIAPSKTLAKLANKLSKNDPKANGVKIIKQEDITSVLEDFPVGDIWGIGSKYSSMLEQSGIKTALQFTNLPRDWIKRKMTINGVRIWQELKGIPCIPIELNPPSKKGICTSRSFGKMLADLDKISEAVSNHATNCAKKLRAQDSSCKVLTVFIHTNGFRTDLKQYYNSTTIILPVASNSSLELSKYALQALRSIYKTGYLYKKAGVIVSDIIPSSQCQGNLFYDLDSIKHSKIMTAMDKINNLYGADKLRLGSQGFGRSWRLKNEMISPCYTTRIADLIKIKV